MIFRLAFSCDTNINKDEEQLLLAAAGCPTIAVYKLGLKACERPFFLYEEHRMAVTAFEFEPTHSNFLYSASEDGTLRVWVPLRDIPGNTLRVYRNKDILRKLCPINDAKMHPTIRLYFTVDSLGRLRLWHHNVRDGGEIALANHVPHPSNWHLHCLDLSSDGEMLVTANFDGFVFIYRVWDLMPNSNAPVMPMVVQPTNRHISRFAFLLVQTHCRACYHRDSRCTK